MLNSSKNVPKHSYEGTRLLHIIMIEKINLNS